MKDVTTMTNMEDSMDANRLDWIGREYKVFGELQTTVCVCVCVCVVCSCVCVCVYDRGVFLYRLWRSCVVLSHAAGSTAFGTCTGCGRCVEPLSPSVPSPV